MFPYTKKPFILLTLCSTASGAVIKNLDGTQTAGQAVSNGWSNPVEGQKAALQFCKEQNYTWAFKALIASAQPVGYPKGKELIKTCFGTENGLCYLSQKACAWIRKCLITDGACKRPPAKAIMDEFARSKKLRHNLDGEEPEDQEFRGKVENFDSKDMDMGELIQGAWDAGVNSLRSVSAANMERLFAYGFVHEELFMHIADSYDQRSIRQAQEIAGKLGETARKEKLIDAVTDPKDRKQFLKGISAGLFFTVACGSQYKQWGHVQDNSFYRWDKNGNSLLIEGGGFVC